MHDISQKDIKNILDTIPKYEHSDLLIFSISLNEFEKQNIFLDDKEVTNYQKGIEKHICLISKNRYLKINEKEFLFIIKKEDTPIKTIEKRILSALYKPVNIGGYTLSIPYLIGSSRYPQDSKNIADCIKFARVTRLYLAEESLKNYAKYEPQIYKSVYEDFLIRNSLMDAIENNELEMYYQPIFNQDKSKIIYFESLLRWKRDGKFINPQRIIEIAEKTENIHLLTEYIAEKVISTLKKWERMYKEIIPVSLNISQSALTNPKLPWKLSTILKKYTIDPKYLKIEITETTSSKIYSSIDYEKITPNKISSELTSIGFELYADDFGIGFSNLEFISTHNFRGIKIDKFFIDKILETRGKYFLGLIRKILEFAKENNQSVICEGIEKKEQLEILNSFGIEFYVQGYLFSKPLSIEEIEKIYLELISLNLNTINSPISSCRS
jgi:EAL domain-containing protein (putative c-di-GMP-specific phosphodiesterase class I)